ncbi:MAG: tetratricopeptide repeat protein [Promethearchaeota archaeon]
METHYTEVRRLIRENKIQEAERIYIKLMKIAPEFTSEERYWFNLLSSEIKRYRKDYNSAKENIEESLLLSKEIELTSGQKSSLNGRMATIHYRMGNYSRAVQFFQNTLSFLSNDLGRQNYYRKMLLNCYFRLEDEENFFKTLIEGLDDIFKSNKLQENWNTNLDFLWDITGYAKLSPWFVLVTKALDFDRHPSNDVTQCVLEYAHARLARQQLDTERFLNHMQKSLRFCTKGNKIDSKNVVSLKLNFVWMLQLLGEYQRAKDILLQCLEEVPIPSGRRIHILNSLGSNLRFTGEYNLAIHYLMESLRINQKEIHDRWQEAYTQNTLGMIYTLIGDNKKATNCYKSSMLLSEEEGDYYGLGFTYGALGWLESNQGNLIQAKKCYESSITIFEENLKTVPPIILLALAELLSKMGDNFSYEIENLLSKAKTQIWTQQRRLDFGRYYNTLGNIALNQKELNQKHLQKASKEFSLALEYCESFEVEAQTLLGITKTNLELFMISADNYEYLEKAKLFLKDLKAAAESSALIRCEVELIFAIIEMHTRQYSKAAKIFDQVMKHAKDHQFILLEGKVQKQREILQILQTHNQLQKFTSKTTDYELKRNSIREAIDYLSELTKLIMINMDKENKT